MKNDSLPVHRVVIIVFVFFASLFTIAVIAGPKPAPGYSGVISGNVIADQGNVRAFRVRATDKAHLISYTVFTNKGQYHIYNLPPSSYELQVRESGYDSPAQTVDLGSGETKTADLALKAKQVTGKVKLVEYDELYPPGPARDILENNCFGCHGYQEGGLAPYHLMAGKTETEWAAGLNKMFWVPGVFPSPTWPSPSASTSLGYNDPGWLNGKQRLLVIKYLAANFPPNHERRDIKLEPMVRDEDALAKAIYIQYVLPPVDESKSPGLSLSRGTHDVMPSRDPTRQGTVWMAENAASSVLRVDTQTLDPKMRFTEWTVHDPRGNFNVGPTAITERNGHVYWTEVMDDNVGDLDIASGKIQRYQAPTSGLAMHGIGMDSQGNIWTAGQPGIIDRLNLETKQFTEWAPSDGLGQYYTLTIDKKDRVWAVSTARQILSMWDPKAQKWNTFKPPHNIRRVSIDSKGMVWLCEYHANMFVMLDPDTGKFTEYKLPLKYGNPYEISADSSDNIWLENAAYQSFVRFDRQIEKFTYFPYPEDRTHTPKVEFDNEGTMWSDLGAGLGQPRLTGFRPYGNVPNQNVALAGKN